MATRFDTIGSQNNVQNPGEGEAYIYDRQAAPLEKLGNTAMKLHLAAQKAKAKQDSGAQTYNTLQIGNGGDLYTDLINNKIAENANMFAQAKKTNDLQGVSKVYAQMNQLNNVASVLKADSDKTSELLKAIRNDNSENIDKEATLENLNNLIQKKRELVQVGDYNISQLDPNSAVVKTATQDDLKKLSDAIGERTVMNWKTAQDNNLMTGQKNTFNPIENRDIMVSNTWQQSPEIRNLYNKQFRTALKSAETLGDYGQFKNYMTPVDANNQPKEGDVVVTQGDKQFVINKAKYGYDSFAKDIKARLDTSENKSVKQLFQWNAGGGGLQDKGTYYASGSGTLNQLIPSTTGELSFSKETTNYGTNIMNNKGVKPISLAANVSARPVLAQNEKPSKEHKEKFLNAGDMIVPKRVIISPSTNKGATYHQDIVSTTSGGNIDFDQTRKNMEKFIADAKGNVGGLNFSVVGDVINKGKELAYQQRTEANPDQVDDPNLNKDLYNRVLIGSGQNGGKVLLKSMFGSADYNTIVKKVTNGDQNAYNDYMRLQKEWNQAVQQYKSGQKPVQKVGAMSKFN